MGLSNGIIFRRIFPFRSNAPLLFSRYLSIAPPEQLSEPREPPTTSFVVRPRRSRTGRTKPVEDYAELPNILQSPNSKFKVISLTENTMDLLDTKSFPYGMEEAVIREWMEVTRSVFTQSGALLSEKVSKEWKKRIISISPSILISYSGGNGELMLKKVTMGLARYINADFLAVDVSEFLNIITFLDSEISKSKREHDPQQSIRSSLVEPSSSPFVVSEERRLLSDFLKLTIKGEFDSIRTSRVPFNIADIQRAYSSRPITTVLEYLEFCIMSMDGASSKRMIYLYGGDSNLFQQKVLCNELASMMSARRSSPLGTLFVISEGSNFDPAHIKDNGSSKIFLEVVEENTTTGNAIVNPPRGLDGLFSRNFPTTISRISGKPIGLASNGIDSSSNSSSGTGSGSTPKEQTFSWIMDETLKAPRLLIVPPQNPQLQRQHQRQLENDKAWFNYFENYSSIIKTLRGMELANNLLGQLVTGLPHPKYCKEIMTLLPSLQQRQLSSSEMVTLCLSIPLDRRVSEDPVGIFAKAVDDFMENRNRQMKAVPSLQVETNSTILPNTFGKVKVKLDDLNKYEKRFVSCIVTPDMVSTTFKDIGALEKVKRNLYELISLRLERPDYFTKGILRDAVSGILLFGPPGTGKTMLAKAVAAQSGANFIAVNSSSIFDMYVGEGEKNVKALFTLARKLAPCIIFVDEVDALLDSRARSVGRASRVEIINEFMAEWDGLLSKNQGITVMAATNRPFALDDAVLRRLPRRILVDLPDSEARTEILKLLLEEDTLSSFVSLESIAKRCEYYSGSDLKNMSMAAAMRALRRLRAGEASGMEIQLEDFDGAMSDVPASISDRMSTINELREWDRLYGEGRLKRTLPSFGFN